MPAKPPTFLASPEGLDRLNAAKARLGLSLAAIAERAGVSVNTVKRLWHPERGERVGRVSIVSILSVLNLQPEEIIFEDEFQKTINIFISYCREEPDSTLAHLFAHTLESKGLNVFIDTNIETGEEWAKKIDDELKRSDYFLLLFSEKTFLSSFVETEIIAALDKRKKVGVPTIWPIRICLPQKHLESRYPWGYIYQMQHEFWYSQEDNDRVVRSFINKIKEIGEDRLDDIPQNLSRETSQQPSKQYSTYINVDGAALSSDSRIYVERDADKEVFIGIQQKRALIHIKGAKQTGKTSLIIRQYQAIQTLGSDLRVILIDFQALPKSKFESINTLWHAIAEQIANSMGYEDWGVKWFKERPYNINLNRFMSDFVFHSCQIPILLGIDGGDCVFNSPIKDEFFASIRALYNLGAYDRTWKNVRWLLSTSTEPKFFIENLSQSPFNIGVRIDLKYFGMKEIQKLATQYEIILEDKILHDIILYLGGHPHLTHLAINKLAKDITFINYLFHSETAGHGLFQEYLDRYVEQFQKETALLIAMKKIVNGNGCDDLKIANQLEGAGLIKRDISQQVVPTCKLYSEYFKGVLNQ